MLGEQRLSAAGGLDGESASPAALTDAQSGLVVISSENQILLLGKAQVLGKLDNCGNNLHQQKFLVIN